MLSKSDVQKTILVVEDDPTMQEILHILLEDCGCRILTTNSGQEAIKLAHATHPEIVTLDLGLPDMDGGEVLRQIQGGPDRLAPYVIVVSGRRFEPEPADHVAAVLSKPFDAAELERLVRDALARSTRSKPAGLA
jgi:CheY-like chemotaxis protein